jgi:hypothetical protein
LFQKTAGSLNASTLLAAIHFCMNTKDRVQANSDRSVNREIERGAARRVAQAAGAPKQVITRRIGELDEEWDIERWLEANASALAFTGTILGLLVNKKFFAIPCIVLPFLFQHAIQGWCPPVPILRRKGVRTRREIDAEKYALKAVRGDFSSIPATTNAIESAVVAWKAANV